MATAGDGGTATAGHGGMATAGHGGTATAGHGGAIIIRFWTGQRLRAATIKDEDGNGELEPNVKYWLDENGEFQRVEIK
jgi:hypothetical protein